MQERMSLIVFSGTVDKLMAASILATGAAAMGLQVEVFLTTWGLEAFRKDDYKTNTKGYSHGTWWINRSALFKLTLGRFFVMRQFRQAFSSLSEAPSEFFC